MADPVVVERNGNGFIYFVIGALVVAVAVIAYIAFANQGDEADISIDLPNVEAPNIDTPDLPSPGGDLDVDINTN